jgi:hypothetical protein
MRLVLAIVSLAVACGVQSARAGGSVALSDLMQSSDTRQISSNFAATIQSALTTANVPASEVFCSGSRLGRQWGSLGGQRIGPYQCNIGGRAVEITAVPTFFDKNGSPLRFNAPAVMKNAVTVKESDFRVNWKD